jgi:hypothetical protein
MQFKEILVKHCVSGVWSQYCAINYEFTNVTPSRMGRKCKLDKYPACSYPVTCSDKDYGSFLK